MKPKPRTVINAYKDTPRPCPIEVKIPFNLFLLTVLLIIKARLGPGDIAPIMQTIIN